MPLLDRAIHHCFGEGASVGECAQGKAAPFDFERIASARDQANLSADLADPGDLDYLYNKIDKLFYAFARGCGVSTCGFWMLYDVYRSGGSVAVHQLTESWSYSKQTINSAVKTLEGKGLVTLAYVEGNRKLKRVELTPSGSAFALRFIRPAIEAEGRAFSQLSEDERAVLISLAKKYTAALDAEMERLFGFGADDEKGCA